MTVDTKIYQDATLSLGASDLIYVSRADGSSDGSATLTALSAIVNGVNGALYAAASHTHVIADITDFPVLADVATSGAYSDLTGTPSLATVATSGAYADLSGKPTLATVATSGAYSDLTGKPSLATVATSGAYSDLTGTPSLGYFATGTDASNLTGTISVNRFNSGTGASSSTFLRGDGTWATPGGGGTVTTSGSPASGNLAKFSSATAITNGDLSGDVTTSGTLAVTIANDAVTYAKMQNVSAASKLLGRGDSGSGDPQEITLGSTLAMSGTTLSTVYNGCMVHKSNDLNGQNITTTTALTWDTEDYDDGGWHEGVTNPSRLTVPSGVTRVDVNANLRINNITSATYGSVQIYKNGALLVGSTAAPNALTRLLSVGLMGYPVTAGDYFEVFVQSVSDTSVDIAAANTFFAIRKVA